MVYASEYSESEVGEKLLPTIAAVPKKFDFVIICALRKATQYGAKIDGRNERR